MGVTKPRLSEAEAFAANHRRTETPLRLNPDVSTASHEGTWPVTLKRQETGFEYFIELDQVLRTDVTDWAEDDLLAIKVSTSQTELNIHVPRSELAGIERVRRAAPRAVRLGTILGAPAWRLIDREEHVLFIVAGQGGETSEVGASLPPSALEGTLAEVAAVVRG
jgi:hypothetical protein